MDKLADFFLPPLSGLGWMSAATPGAPLPPEDSARLWVGLSAPSPLCPQRL